MRLFDHLKAFYTKLKSHLSLIVQQMTAWLASLWSKIVQFKNWLLKQIA
jgi:hypothetical protein